MKKVNEIIRLNEEAGMSLRQIANALNISRPAVTNILTRWKEYIKENPVGLKSTQFCLHFQKWRDDEKISMHIDHKAGDKMFVDYTGHKMELTYPRTGKTILVEVFVTILPASQLTYAEAAESQNQESCTSSEPSVSYTQRT